MEAIKSLELRFESQCSMPIILKFVGLVDFRLKPADDNHTGDLFDCSIIIKDEIIYFFTSYISEIDEQFDGTWAKAYEARWKFV